MRGLWLALGTALTVAALAVSTSLVWEAVADAHPPSEVSWRSIPFRGGSLKIEAGQDDVRVHIQAGQAGSIGIERGLAWTGRKPTVSEEWDGGTLRIDGVCPGDHRPGEPACMIHYQLFVPPETDVEASTSASVGVSRMRGAVSLTSVWGDIDAYDLTGDVRLRSETGDIDARRLRGDLLHAEVGTGRMWLAFDTPPTDVRAVARASGDIEVELPEGVYDVTATAPETSVDTRRDPSSSRKVRVSTPDGEVFIRD